MKKYQNIKNFRLIDAPVNRDKTQAEINIGAYFLESDDGQDWYECQSLFSDDTAKIMYDHEGVIWGVVNKPVPQRGNTYSVSMLWPVNMSVAEIDAADCLMIAVVMVRGYIRTVKSFNGVILRKSCVKRRRLKKFAALLRLNQPSHHWHGQ